MLVRIAAVPATLLAAVTPARAGITVGPIDPNSWTFRLFAAVSGGGPGDGQQVQIELHPPPGATQFNPNDATGTISDSGQNGTATGSAAGAAFTNFSLANDVLTAHATVAFNTNGAFVTATRPHDQFGGGSGEGEYEFDLPIQVTGGLYEYSYSIQSTHDLLGDTGGLVSGRVHFIGSPTDIINLEDQHRTGSGTTSVSDRGVLASNVSGSLDITFDADSSAGPFAQPSSHHGNGTLDVQFTLRPANQWKNPAGGSFQTAANWTGNVVPASTDVAVFNLPGTYSVQLDQPVTNATLHSGGSGVNVTFDVAGHPYTVDKMEVGGNPGDNVHLSFIDSGAIVAAVRSPHASTPPPITLSVPGSFNVGTGGRVDIGGPTSAGTVNVNGGGQLNASGAGAQWLVQSLLLGTTGSATFTISNKANVTSSFANLGVGATGNAAVTVSDKGTEWDSGQLVVGGQGTGSLTLLAFGEVQTNNVLVGASPTIGVGTITVDGGNTGPTITSSSLFQQSGGSGLMVIGDQGAGHLVVRNVGIVQVDGTLEVGRSGGGKGDITVTDPSSIIHAENLKLGTLGTGTLSLSNGGKLATSEQLVGRAIIGSNGTMTLSNGSVYDARTSLEVDGRLQIDSSSQVNVGSGFGTPGTLTIAAGGTLLGSGTISVPKLVMLGGTNRATLKPGHSPGTLTIDGNLEQDPGSTIKIEIAGTQPGQFDVLNVTGTASYQGDLLLSFQDGFAPHQGDTFAFLNTAGSVTGSFAAVHLHDIAPGFQFNLQPQSGGVEALVALNDAISTRIPGDANDDGKVDFTDLLILAQNFGQNGTYSTGDFNLDGSVDFTDLLTLAQNFGQVAPPEPAAQAFAVPEPTALAGVVLVLSLSTRRMRSIQFHHDPCRIADPSGKIPVRDPV